MNRLKNIFILIVAVTCFASCNKWLDITPKGQVDERELLKDVKGYNSAINGVYTIIASDGLYGRNLTYGTLDVAAQYWTVNSSNTYYDLLKYNYQSKNCTDKFNQIWGDLYLGIGQCNAILQSLKINEGQIANANLFKGEAIALRAFLHFDALRLFAPAPRNGSNLDKPAIPYRTTFNNEAIRFSTVGKTIDQIRADFLTALELLKNDPIKVSGRTGDWNKSMLGYNSVIDRRGSRMNYFAILGLLARLELYAGNKLEASTYAERVIKECEETIVNTQPILHLSNKEDFDHESNVFRDIICSSEMLFSVYVNKLWDYSGVLFGFKDFTSKSKEMINISLSSFTTIQNFVYGRVPDGAGTDYRIKYWFAKKEGSASAYEFAKVKKPEEPLGMNPPSYPELSIIKLSEIYYIATETQIGLNNTKALEYLNKVRDHRGLVAIDGKDITDDKLMTYLTRECRKEFYGEGQMFYFYKRLFKEIEVADKVSISPLESMFVWPIPEDEYEYSPNEKPTKGIN